MNIALIVHFTPRTLRETRGRGHVVLSSEMAGGKKKKISRKGHTPHVRHGREGEGEKGGGRCVCVCVVTFRKDRIQFPNTCSGYRVSEQL